MQARPFQVASSPAVAAGRPTCMALPRRYRPSSRALLRPLHHADGHRRCSTQLTSERHSTCAQAAPPASSLSGQQPNLAIFVSGGGSNFRAIDQACLSGEVHATVAVVVTNMPNCGGAALARERGIPVLVYPGSKKVPGFSPEELVEKLRQEHEVDFVILAGYLKLIPSQLVRAYRRRMLNIHPGLLPAFGGPGLYGLRVHSAVVQSGARISGPTVHFVDEEYDTGPILAQSSVPVKATDTPLDLAARVLKEEHKLYPRCVAALCDGRITWRDDGIPIMWTAE